MCGRYALILEPDGFRRWIANPSDRLLADLEREGRLIRVDGGGSDIVRRPRFAAYDVPPTNIMPIVTNRDGRPDMEAARWGLIPSW